MTPGDYSPNIIDQWPESRRLREVLSARNLTLDRCYTMPGLKTNSALEDLMATTLLQQLNTIVDRPTATRDMNGVKSLIAAGHLRAAVNLTAELLTKLKQGYGMAGQPSGNTKCSFEVWACRFQLLFALKMYTLLNEELLPFEELDAPDLYYQYYQSIYKKDEKGSLVPFSLRLVHAEALRFTSSPWTAIERIDALENNINELLNGISEKADEFVNVWKARLLSVQKMRARTLYFLKEYTTSMMLFNRISESQTDPDERIVIKLLLIRMAIAVGDEKKMERFLAETSQASSDQLAFYRCLKFIFAGNYSSAHETLQNNFKGSTSTAMVNNSAVCLLYIGRVKNAMNRLISIANDPNEPIAINLYTISELTVPDFALNSATSFAERFIRLPDMFDPNVIKLSPTA